ncbi:hypothetical protein AB4142_30670, partial [Variovorax sp. 2RAF20]
YQPGQRQQKPATNTRRSNLFIHRGYSCLGESKRSRITCPEGHAHPDKISGINSDKLAENQTT